MSHPKNLLQSIDALIASHTEDPHYVEQLRALRAEALADYNHHLLELQQLRDEARADVRKLKSKAWLQRVIFLGKELLDYFDSTP